MTGERRETTQSILSNVSDEDLSIVSSDVRIRSQCQVDCLVIQGLKCYKAIPLHVPILKHTYSTAVCSPLAEIHYMIRSRPTLLSPAGGHNIQQQQKLNTTLSLHCCNSKHLTHLQNKHMFGSCLSNDLYPPTVTHRPIFL